MGRACVLFLAAAAVAVGAVPTSYRATSTSSLRGPPASSEPSLASLATHLSNTPSFVQVSEGIRSGAPVNQIIEFLRKIRDEMRASQLEDEATQKDIQSGCEKEVADAKSFVAQIESEINGVSIHKDTLVSDTDLASKELQLHDNKARKAQVEKQDAELRVRDLQTQLQDVMQVIEFTQKKEEPRLLRLAGMVDKVESMKTLIQEAIGKPSTSSSPLNVTQSDDAETDKDNTAATSSNTTVFSMLKDPRSNATSAVGSTKQNATAFLELEGRRASGGAHLSALQMADAAATQAVRALALQITGAQPGSASEAEVSIDANTWVTNLLARMDSLKSSFSDELSKAKASLNATQASNVVREADIKQKLADAQEKLKALTMFLDKQANAKVGTAKATIERLGSEVADATVSLERSKGRLKDAKMALTESQNTCKTYAEQYADRQSGRKQQLRLADHLLEVITKRLEDIRRLLRHAQGQ